MNFLQRLLGKKEEPIEVPAPIVYFQEFVGGHWVDIPSMNDGECRRVTVTHDGAVSIERKHRVKV